MWGRRYSGPAARTHACWRAPASPSCHALWWAPAASRWCGTIPAMTIIMPTLLIPIPLGARPTAPAVSPLGSCVPLLIISSSTSWVLIPEIRGHAMPCASWVWTIGQVGRTVWCLNLLSIIVKCNMDNAATAALGKIKILLQPGSPRCLNAFSKRTMNLQQAWQPYGTVQLLPLLEDLPMARTCEGAIIAPSGPVTVAEMDQVRRQLQHLAQVPGTEIGHCNGPVAPRLAPKNEQERLLEFG
eukprot:1163263-Amphidinium_carterae.2